jgi:hypothetical protein
MYDIAEVSKRQTITGFLLSMVLRTASHNFCFSFPALEGTV